MSVKGNGQWREVFYGLDLSPENKGEIPCFQYMGSIFRLDEFLPNREYDGCMAMTPNLNLLIKLSQDGKKVKVYLEQGA